MDEITRVRTNSVTEGHGTEGVQKQRANYVDCHVHVWTNDFQKYPLAAGFTQQEMIPSTFLPEDILRIAQQSAVDRVVLVQMSYYGFANSYLLDTIGQSPRVFRGVAVVNWKASHPEKQMRELARKGVRGFRIYPGSDSPSTWLDQEGFSKMFQYGADEGLAMCLLISPDAITSISRKCKEYPHTSIVIDHLAGIGENGRAREEDINALCSLAQFPQLKVKLSAFYALGEKKPPHLDLIPLIKRVYEAFGPRRLMWGSDCPFQILEETYEDSISLIRDRLDFLSSNDKDWILGKTAAEVFFR